MTRQSSLSSLELWAKAALFLALATLGVFVYLGLRPGGETPIRVYQNAPFLIGPLALLVGAWGLVSSFRRKPFVQRGRLLGFFAAASSILVSSYPHPYPSSHAASPSGVEFRLPFLGEWTVRWGGRERRHNALVDTPDRCFGYHFVRSDSEGLTGMGTESGSLSARGQVIAPAAGTLVDRFSAGELRAHGEVGEVLVIEVGPDQYLFIGGLDAETVVVPVGSAIEAEQFLGHVDAAGWTFLTPEPHISVHLQDRPEPHRGEGIPMRFVDYRSGGRTVDSGEPRGGLGPKGQHIGHRVQAAGETSAGSD